MALSVDSPVSDFIKYVEDNNLYNSFNKMLVQCDDTLKEILGVDSFAFFGLERILKLKQKEEIVKEKIMVSDDMSLEEIAAKILLSLQEAPMDLMDVEDKESESEKEKSTPSTPPTPDYKEEEPESEYENFDEFDVVDFYRKGLHIEQYERNGVRLIKFAGYVFEAEDLVNYLGGTVNDMKEPVEDRWNEGLFVGAVSVFLVFTLFSLWLSLVNYGMCRFSKA